MLYFFQLCLPDFSPTLSDLSLGKGLNFSVDLAGVLTLESVCCKERQGLSSDEKEILNSAAGGQAEA